MVLAEVSRNERATGTMRQPSPAASSSMCRANIEPRPCPPLLGSTSVWVKMILPRRTRYSQESDRLLSVPQLIPAALRHVDNGDLIGPLLIVGHGASQSLNIQSIAPGCDGGHSPVDDVEFGRHLVALGARIRCNQDRPGPG